MSSTLHKHYTGNPVVARTTEAFVEHIAVAGETKRFEYVKPILWLLESETALIYRHGGKTLKDGATYNDYYGLLSSTTGAAEDALCLAKAFEITPDSTLELVAVATIKHTPVAETPETIELNKRNPADYKRCYVYVPNDWRQERIEDGQKIFPTLASKTLAQEVVWSSKRSEADNEAVLSAFKAKWLAAAVEA